MTSQPPDVPRDAAPFVARQALGSDTIAAAWTGCFNLGVEAGKAEAYVSFGLGALVASGAWIALFVFTLGVAYLMKGVGRQTSCAAPSPVSPLRSLPYRPPPPPAPPPKRNA